MVDSIYCHEFGSQNTEIKLEVVKKYLETYTKALRNIFENLLYIDAFAGTGERTVRVKNQEGNLIDEEVPEHLEQYKGSAQIALDIKPAFDKLIFMDIKRAHIDALNELREHYPNRNIEILKGDANELLRETLRKQNWKKTRAVMFLDPYGMSVDWNTLKLIAETKAIDVWYLFSLSGLYRQAARDRDNIDTFKKEAITRMLGTKRWMEELYARKDDEDLFGYVAKKYERTIDVGGLEQYVKKRLQEIFPAVLEPLQLPVCEKPQRFSLFCAISNDSPKAKRLAERFGNHIINEGKLSHLRFR